MAELHTAGEEEQLDAWGSVPCLDPSYERRPPSTSPNCADHKTVAQSPAQQTLLTSGATAQFSETPAFYHSNTFLWERKPSI